MNVVFHSFFVCRHTRSFRKLRNQTPKNEQSFWNFTSELNSSWINWMLTSWKRYRQAWETSKQLWRETLRTWNLETSMLFLLQVSPYAFLSENDTTKTFLVFFETVLIEFSQLFLVDVFVVFWYRPRKPSKDMQNSKKQSFY